MSGTRGPLLVLLVALVTLAGPSGAQLSVELLDSPDVVVANNVSKENNPPHYTFTATVRVSNGEEAHNVSVDAITYVDTDVEGCPTDGTEHPPVPVHRVAKQYELEPQESVTIGGSDDPSTASEEPDAYWPLVVFKEYPSREGDNVTYPAGEHAFCVAAFDVDCAQKEGPTRRECVLDRATFRSYVRRNNAPPAIQSVEHDPQNPRPGQTTLFEAEAVDNSTKPRQDQLTYTWELGPRTIHGATVQHAFPTERVHNVTLRVSDGFDTTERTIRVPVGDVSLDSGDESNDSPTLAPVGLAGLLAAAALLRRG